MESTENQDDLIIKQQREIEKEVEMFANFHKNKCRLKENFHFLDF